MEILESITENHLIENGFIYGVSEMPEGFYYKDVIVIKSDKRNGYNAFDINILSNRPDYDTSTSIVFREDIENLKNHIDNGGTVQSLVDYILNLPGYRFKI